MWVLDRFSNPLWYKVSRLDKPRRRTVATALCAYDFLRQQVESSQDDGSIQECQTGKQEYSEGTQFGRHPSAQVSGKEPDQRHAQTVEAYGDPDQVVFQDPEDGADDRSLQG